MSERAAAYLLQQSKHAAMVAVEYAPTDTEQKARPAVLLLQSGGRAGPVSYQEQRWVRPDTAEIIDGREDTATLVRRSSGWFHVECSCYWQS